ncbi:hypothetical protein GTU26_000667 [Salmonella enterica subsp. enterica]|nr:hypothetical protein [Salmonella enterica]EBG0573692.1 hypothetical protein [Salmonella enterica subsp. enterica serovar Stanleyville]EBG9321419.1 hypothetical protein [Salmonella enterica subsp. enterica serovar Saintpaul]EDV9275764.1 hypothetical protein [Salmonella enterica subsp. enterica]EEJ9085586.1 hypothetical protein [Salmonella enterica subsp. salamae]
MPIKPRPILPAPKCNAFIVLTFINVFTREGWGEGLHRFPLNLTLSTRERVSPSYFELQMRWLSSLTPVTYLCTLLGGFTALPPSCSSNYFGDT